MQNVGGTSSASLRGPFPPLLKLTQKVRKPPCSLSINDQEATGSSAFESPAWTSLSWKGADHAPNSMDGQRLRPTWLSPLKEDPVVTSTPQIPQTISTWNRCSCSGLRVPLCVPLSGSFLGSAHDSLFFCLSLPLILLTVSPLSSQFCYSHFIYFLVLFLENTAVSSSC